MVRKIGFTVIPDRVNDPCFGSGGFLAGFRVLGSNLTGFLDAGVGIQAVSYTHLEPQEGRSGTK